MTVEIERFLTDARGNAGLQTEIAQKSGDLDALIGLANARGYTITRPDADAYIAARKAELSDGDLDHVAGGGHKKKVSASDIIKQQEDQYRQWKYG